MVEVFVERYGGQERRGHAVAAKRRGARKPGPCSSRLPGAASASPASSSAASRAASRSISTAPWRSCRAARSISARCATSRPLMGTPQPFQILKMDRSRGNIVVSRRAVLEESRAEARSELVAKPEGRPDPRRRRQEHHRLRRVRRSGRRRRPAARHRHRLEAHQSSVRSAAYRPDRQGAGHPLQPGDPAHQPRHEAA